jgi:hypothetical protein
MATVTLRNLNRLRAADGTLFERGVAKEMSAAKAKTYEDNDRFHVRYAPGEDRNVEAAPVVTDGPSKKPTSRAEIIAAIQGAIDQLDINNESHYTTSGKPDARALTSILGWQVTGEERDAALADAAPAQSNVRVVRRQAPGRVPEPLDTGADRDPSIEDAVQVA